MTDSGDIDNDSAVDSPLAHITWPKEVRRAAKKTLGSPKMRIILEIDGNTKTGYFGCLKFLDSQDEFNAVFGLNPIFLPIHPPIKAESSVMTGVPTVLWQMQIGHQPGPMPPRLCRQQQCWRLFECTGCQQEDYLLNNPDKIIMEKSVWTPILSFGHFYWGDHRHSLHHHVRRLSLPPS